MTRLRFILGDQLSAQISSLQDIDRQRDVVLMVEVHEEATYVRHHKQKLVLIFSAMRHFAEELKAKGLRVDYVRLDAAGNAGSFTEELARAIHRHRPERVVVTEPGEWRVWQMMQRWQRRFGLPVEIREDTRYLCTRTQFEAWAQGRKQLRMESFYHWMRRQTGWLMSAGKPVGGRWNYDVENRKPLPHDISLPKVRRFRPDRTTRDVMALVDRRFSGHFGDTASFAWGVTRQQARTALRQFVRQRLARFGDYQDAMSSGSAVLFHGALSPYLNLGLLRPREVCEAVLRAHLEGGVPLAAAEGFVRQILGWREYMRGIYWLHMPGYAQTNFLKAKRRLPQFYWTGETDMHCMRQAIGATHRNAYAHHIQRLMVTGNFALLAGIEPAQVEEWYLIVYADAYDWVELPNTHGMSLYADGGLLASKPYAASGAYIDRMSDYCGKCVYNPKRKLGPEACPFNYLYWHFLMRNRSRLAHLPRVAMAYRTLDRMDPARRERIGREARAFLSQLS